MKSKTWEEIYAEARLNLPDPKMYEKEIFSTKVFYDTENYTTVHFKKVYGSPFKTRSTRKTYNYHFIDYLCNSLLKYI